MRRRYKTKENDVIRLVEYIEQLELDVKDTEIKQKQRFVRTNKPTKK